PSTRSHGGPIARTRCARRARGGTLATAATFVYREHTRGANRRDYQPPCCLWRHSLYQCPYVQRFAGSKCATRLQSVWVCSAVLAADGSFIRDTSCMAGSARRREPGAARELARVNRRTISAPYTTHARRR